MTRSLAAHIPVFAGTAQADGGDLLVEVIAPRERESEREAWEAKVRQAFERGQVDGELKLRDRFEAEKERLIEDHEKTIANLKRRLDETAGEQLATQLEEAFVELEARLGDAIADILEPFVRQSVLLALLDGFAGAIRHMLLDAQARTLTLRGPEAMLARVQDRLGPLAATVAFEPSHETELRASLGSTVIETQFAAWKAQLDEERERA